MVSQLSWPVRRGVGATTVPSSFHGSVVFVSVLSDADRAVNNECGLGDPSFCWEKMPQAPQGDLSSIAWHFYPSYLAGKLKIRN